MTGGSGIVVDASVIVAALTASKEYQEWAQTVLKSGPNEAPELVLFEAANILRRLELAGQLSARQAATAFQELSDWPVQLWPFGPLASRIWQLRQSVTAYDAAYVALAEQLDLPLATLDRRLVAAHGPACRFLTAD
ncbi:PilT protein domain-containing protein [Arthrobacter crystallopoietes BAB-32]|uniref:Ribonuclease VapC n=1 Tax=Arthrobacter crystallopoietes BAB-32 TaxID=1246476 RepID=N1V285_9MICC|nr:type II toxin-antitoxin system VapC family toxin [Arthrobacter crystallopoietes]EMY32343.1 PilT protein domain-containing protein [Arthrobacter crystallopoietes BAB-32]